MRGPGSGADSSPGQKEALGIHHHHTNCSILGGVVGVRFVAQGGLFPWDNGHWFSLGAPASWSENMGMLMSVGGTSQENSTGQSEHSRDNLIKM